MFKQKAIIGYVGLSLGLHAAFFMASSYPILSTPITKGPLQVSYQKTPGPKIPVLPQDIEARSRKINSLPGFGIQKRDVPLWTQNRIASDLIKEDFLKKSDALTIARKPISQKENILQKKSVNLPDIPGETFKTPAYKSYYQLIREKIRRYAYYNYKKLEEGDVFLTFSLNANGELKDVVINDAKSAKSEYLRQTALLSVKDSNPFPAFPEKLKNNKMLSFHVIISFEIK